jgi:hypothetical protein
MHPDKPEPNPWVELLVAARRLLNERNRLIMEKGGMQISIFDHQIIIWGEDRQPIAKLDLMYPASPICHTFKDGWDHAKVTRLFNSL